MQWWQRKLLEIDLSVNHTINHYFIVRPNVVQRAGQLSLPHVAISKTGRNRKTSIKPMSSLYNTPWIKPTCSEHPLEHWNKSRDAHPCSMVPRCQVSRCPPLRYGAVVPRCPVSRCQSPQFWWSRDVRSRVFSRPVSVLYLHSFHCVNIIIILLVVVVVLLLTWSWLAEVASNISSVCCHFLGRYVLSLHACVHCVTMETTQLHCHIVSARHYVSAELDYTVVTRIPIIWIVVRLRHCKQSSLTVNVPISWLYTDRICSQLLVVDNTTDSMSWLAGGNQPRGTVSE